jgi:hypothetical protein
MILGGQVVFHSYYFRGFFLLLIVMLHHTFSLLSFLYLNMTLSHDKWVRHHGMACTQVADGGTASNMEGSFKYIE